MITLSVFMLYHISRGALSPSWSDAGCDSLKSLTKYTTEFVAKADFVKLRDQLVQRDVLSLSEEEELQKYSFEGRNEKFNCLLLILSRKGTIGVKKLIECLEDVNGDEHTWHPELAKDLRTKYGEIKCTS